jgi:peroxiredoxin-like protein
MTALRFDVDLEWQANPILGEITVGGVRTTVSEPRVMGGTGVGMSPEDLFVAAAASSYSVTLADMLRAAGLPQFSLAIRAEGLVASDPGAVKFTTVTVRPTIYGADAAQRQAYEKAAIAARNHCFIGRSIRGNIAYVVGEVALVESAK